MDALEPSRMCDECLCWVGVYINHPYVAGGALCGNCVELGTPLKGAPQDDEEYDREVYWDCNDYE